MLGKDAALPCGEIMKILMLTDRMEAGGAETHIAQLIRGLRRMGAEVWLLCGGGELANELEEEGVRVVRVPLPSHALWKLWKTRRRICTLVRRERFDLLHAHARIPAFLLRGVRRMGCAVVVSVHARFRSDPFLSRLCYWGERTVAVSEDLRGYVCEKYDLPAERIQVISNGIDCERFSPPAERSGEGVRILFASRLDADCSLGAELLCALAPSLLQRYPALTVEILGGGSEYERIRARAEEINLAHGTSVIYVRGWEKNMPARLREADVFVGVSRAAMEACACGCAVVLCGNEGFGGILCRENADRASCSNFCARGEPIPSAELLESALIALLEDADRRRELGEFCRTLMLSRFTSEQMCRQTYALYHRCIRPRSSIRVVVGGYFGCGNAGDDAILLGMLEGLHDAASEIEVIALSGSPRRDSRRFGVRCVSRKNPIAILIALSRARLFICGGGSLLQNLTSSRSLFYYLGLLRLSSFLGVPTAICAAGIGPLLGKSACRRVARALNRSRYVGLRDADSLRLLSSIGVDAARLHLGADAAFLMPLPPRERGIAILSAHGLSDADGYLGLVLRGGASTALSRRLICTAVRVVCLRHHLIPLIPILDAQRDDVDLPPSLVELGARAIEVREPSDAAAVLGVCKAAVVMRLHALVFATAMKISAVGIPADPQDAKIASFARTVGQELILPEELSVGALVERLESCLCERRSVAPRLFEASAELRHRAQKELSDVCELLRSDLEQEK